MAGLAEAVKSMAINEQRRERISVRELKLSIVISTPRF